MTLERYWNQLLESNSFSLFCGYPIDVFGTDFHKCDVDALFSVHTHFLPSATEDLEKALNRAMNEILGPQADVARRRFLADAHASWAQTLKAEALILWLRRNLREHADEILHWAKLYHRETAVSH